MRSQRVPFVCLLLVSAVVVAGCGSSARTSSSSSAPSTAASSAVLNHSTSGDSQVPSSIGGTWTLTTRHTTIRVWLLKYLRGVAGDGHHAPHMARFDAAYVKISNIGSGAYRDFLDDCVTATNTAGNGFVPPFHSAKTPAINGVNIPAGQTRAGWVTLDVAGTINAVTFTADDGMGRSGQWNVR
jgi:hypothetical protein